MSDDILGYCAGDVRFLPHRRHLYWNKPSNKWKLVVTKETRKRVSESHSPAYRPQGKDKTLGPWKRERLQPKSIDDHVLA